MFHEVGQLRAQHWLTAREVDLPAAKLAQFCDYLFEASHRDGWLACLAPMLAHLTLEIASIVHFNFDINGLIGAGMQNSLAHLIFFGSYLLKVIHVCITA